MVESRSTQNRDNIFASLHDFFVGNLKIRCRDAYYPLLSQFLFVDSTIPTLSCHFYLFFLYIILTHTYLSIHVTYIYGVHWNFFPREKKSCTHCLSCPWGEYRSLDLQQMPAGPALNSGDMNQSGDELGHHNKWRNSEWSFHCFSHHLSSFWL